MRDLGALAVLLSAVLAPAGAIITQDHQGRSIVAIESGFLCKSCMVLTQIAQEAAASKIAADAAGFLAQLYCEKHQGAIGYHCEGDWACRDMCGGAVHLYKDEIMYIASRLLLDPTTNCIKLGACPNTTSVTLPPFDPVPQPPVPEVEAQYQPSGAGIVRVLHLTDMHWDMEYHVGANAECGQPMCCRQVQGAPSGPNTTCGYYGDYNSDAPQALVESMLAAAAQLDPPVDIAFLTGDDPSHAVWNQTHAITQVSVAMAELVRKHLPKVPAFPALGNHNSNPINQFKLDPSEDRDWLYEPLARAYAPWLPESALETFRLAGYYTAPIPNLPKARVVALNLGLHVSENFWTLLNQDGNLANMTAWLTDTLERAQAAGERVYLLGHYPLNEGAFWPEWLEGQLQPLLQKHRDIIMAVFAGHTHNADALVTYDRDEATPIITSYVGSSSAPLAGVNPTFRVLDVDAGTGRVLDYTDYRVDMQAQGLLHNTDPAQPAPKWVPAYSAKAAYGMDSLSPAQWVAMATRMRADDALFAEWERNYATGSALRIDTSSKERISRVCGVLGGTATQVNRCKATTQLKLAAAAAADGAARGSAQELQ